MQENINKWPKNENQARKVASGIRELSSPQVAQSTSWQSTSVSARCPVTDLTTTTTAKLLSLLLLPFSGRFPRWT